MEKIENDILNEDVEVEGYKMTFKRYMENPTNSRAMAVTIRATQEAFGNTYIKYKKEHRKNTRNILKIGDKYLLYFKIESSKIDKLFYDICVELDGSGKDSEVRFFSNNPAFVFNMAYVYNMEGLFIDEFANKVGVKALKDAPIVTNPMGVITYEKYLYYVCLDILNDKLYDKSVLDKELEKNMKLKDLIEKIDTVDEKIHEYKIRQKSMVVKNKEENRSKNIRTKALEKHAKRELTRANEPDSHVRKVKPIVRTVNKIKPKSKTVNRIKPKKKI